MGAGAEVSPHGRENGLAIWASVTSGENGPAIEVPRPAKRGEGGPAERDRVRGGPHVPLRTMICAFNFFASRMTPGSFAVASSSSMSFSAFA